MPHIIIKLFPGRTEEQKETLTRRIVDIIEETAGVDENAVSVSFEEVAPEDWDELVVKPDIAERKDQVTKFPGYASKYLPGDADGR
jgi:4-oxalocrotonate tautomerase